MDANILHYVAKSLDSKHYATNSTWLRDCVEYYLSEHNNVGYVNHPKSAEVVEFVITQWQLSDLREICNEKPCLPTNLANKKCITLPGHFILQMDKLYNISESKYKQIEKIRNVSNVNLEITDGEKTQAAWEPKKKRMLHLYMTDGVQDVVAIEYKPIRFLKDDLLPGYKLMIKGPVTCRQGVIMLDETNVAEIGGEVASLLVPNAVENVLARALNLPENPDPYNDNDKRNEENDDALFNDDFDIDMNDVVLIERQSQGSTCNRPNDTNFTDFNISRQSRDSIVIVPEREPCPSPVPLNSKSESQLFFDSNDDTIFETLTENKPQTLDFPKSCETRMIDLTKEMNSSKNVNNPVIMDTERSDDRLNDETVWKNSAKLDEPVVEVTLAKQKFNPRPSANEKSSFSATAEPSRIKVDNSTPECTVPMSIKHPTTNLKGAAMRNPAPATNVKRPSAVLSPQLQNLPAEKIHCAQTFGIVKTNKGDRKITDYMKKDESPKTVSTAQKLCDTVSDVLTANVTDSVSFKTIKGQVTKFDKLVRNGQFWQLNATIMDDTGSVDAAFSPEILESMLGFSVAEFACKRKLGKTDPEIENYLRRGFRSAEKKVSNYNGYLQIELAPDEKPKIVKMESNEYR